MPEIPESESGSAEWEIVKDLVFQWETDQPDDLGAWLKDRCAKEEIRQEVERLVRAAATSGNFLKGGSG